MTSEHQHDSHQGTFTLSAGYEHSSLKTSLYCEAKHLPRLLGIMLPMKSLQANETLTARNGTRYAPRLVRSLLDSRMDYGSKSEARGFTGLLRFA